MYRICDFTNVDNGENIRYNIDEKLAKIGVVYQLREHKGNWKLIRTHGYSIFPD